MKILYLIKNELDNTAKMILEEHRKSDEVTSIDIRENRNYDEIIDLIASSDRIISL
ncbi:MAG: hypothetical protein AABY42_00255 [Nitrospirota bacterium]